MIPISDYDYQLPPERIAQHPSEPRDHSRLLVLDRSRSELEHCVFYEIERFLRPGDLLVANNSRVLPARLHGHKASGGRIEALLLRQIDALSWEALIKGKVTTNTSLHFAADPPLVASVTALHASGTRTLRFTAPINARLAEVGRMPLPPYITAPLSDTERYQTVYSREAGSAAAPTAGLHWTPELLERVRDHGVAWAEVTLHVGLDTFRPVQVENALEHPMHSEWFTLPPETAAAINATRTRGGRIIAVGTTSVRVLETVGREQSGAASIGPASGWTSIFIHPPHQFQLVDGLITNFHLPRSTLLLLVSALAGRERIMAAYRSAIEREYRFFSFGDAMLIV